MLIAIHELKLYAHCYTFSEALSSFLYMVRSFELIVIHGVKFYAHCYKWSEALCSMLYQE